MGGVLAQRHGFLASGDAPSSSVCDLTDPLNPCAVIVECCAVLWAVVCAAWLFSMDDKAVTLGLEDKSSGSLSLVHLAFLAMLCTGLFCFMLGAVSGDLWGLSAAAFLMTLCLFCFVFVGDDPFLTKVLKDRVARFQNENDQLSHTQKELQSKSKDLEAVTSEIKELQGKLGGQDISELENILKTLHTMFALDTVCTFVQHFFNSDLDNSGHISGQESKLFMNSLPLLWEMVPDESVKQDFEKHVHHNGLDLFQLTLILDVLIKGDPVACRRQLEKLIDSGPSPARSGGSFPGRGDAPAQLEEEYDELGAAPSSMGSWESAAAPPDKGAIGGSRPSHMRCFLRWVFMLTAVLAGLMLAAALANENVPCAVCSGLALLLSVGLNVFSGQLDNLMQLRREVNLLHVANSHLREDVKQIGDRVSELQKLQVGLKQLRSKFHDNVKAAIDDIHKRQTLLKTAVGSTLTAIFKDMTVRKGKVGIEPREVEEFYKRVEYVFRDKPGFDTDDLKKQVMRYENRGMDSRDLLHIIGTVVNGEK